MFLKNSVSSHTRPHSYDFIYMKCSEKANPYKQEADWWLPGAVGKGREEAVLVMKVF